MGLACLLLLKQRRRAWHPLVVNHSELRMSTILMELCLAAVAWAPTLQIAVIRVALTSTVIGMAAALLMTVMLSPNWLAAVFVVTLMPIAFGLASWP